MSEETKQLLIIYVGIFLAVCVISLAMCYHSTLELEKTKIYLEKGYHLVDGDWLQ